MSHGPRRLHRPCVLRWPRSSILGILLVVAVTLFQPGEVRADLTPPTGNAVTAGLVSGMVWRDGDNTSLFVDGEAVWTYFPSEFAGGVLTPGVVVDLGYQLDPSRGRATLAAKLGILYVFSVEAGYANRFDADDFDSGPSARLRLNVPLGEFFYLTAHVRSSWLRDGPREDEIGIGLKVRLWGDSYKLEGLIN